MCSLDQHLQTRFRVDAPWLAAALVLGSLGGMLVPRTDGRIVSLVFGGIVALAVVVLVMRDTRYGLYVMLLALPLDLAGRILTDPVTLTVYHVTLLLALLSWAVRVARLGPDPSAELTLVHLGALLLIAASVWSLPFSLDRSATLVAIVRLTFLVAFFMVFTRHMRDERTMDRVLGLVVGTAAASAVLAVAQYFIPGLRIGQVATLGVGSAVIVRPSAFFTDPNYLAALLSVAIVAAFARAAHARTITRAAPWLIGAAVSSTGLVVTLSRTGWVGVGVGLVVALAFAPARRRSRLLLGLLGAVVAVAALSPEWATSRLDSITNPTADGSTATRWLMYGSTIEMIEDYWLFGTGLDAYDEAYPAYRKPGAMRDIFKPHQLPLALPAEMGILGLLAELLIVGGVVVEVVRHRHRGWNPWEGAGLAGLVALLVQSLFQYYLYFEYLWLFLALTVAATRLARSAEEV